ncbi:hypothetical protein [Paenibacillus ihuae]|uniref:hypothetical protein n=1 Tax=Paenibacillus ihuae TaxID=1232431 RepID=UPI0006D58177|nr:hypothetical protein [Paenibacillus ihuae]
MKSKQFENSANTSDQKPEWYRQAGRSPFQEDGFTPELMARIELTADSRAAAGRRFFSRKRFSLAGLSALLLLGVLVWPLGSFDKGDYAGQIASLFGKTTAAAVQPSAVPAPSAAAKDYNPPVGSAEFEIGGQKYYMPLPLDRNKSLAYAAETSEGIVWSPPPPMVDYMKPKYTHNTEPYSLYLTPKGHPELSAASAKRIYTFPLYAGGAQTYYKLSFVDGAGKYALLISGTYTLGGELVNSSKAKLSVLDVQKAAAGATVTPREILTVEKEYGYYKSFISIDLEHEELLLVYYTPGDNEKWITHNKLYNLESGESQVLTGEITIDQKDSGAKSAKITTSFSDSDLNALIQSKILTAHYEVNGEKRSPEFTLPLGQQWIYDWWLEEYNVKYEPQY